MSSQTNYGICIDHTQLGELGFCFCAIDLASRGIVGHCFKDRPFNSLDIIDTLRKIIQERSFLPNIEIIHSDRESLFRNINYEQFLEENKIKISVGSAEAHSNQVIERFFRTFKNIVRKRLQPSWIEGQKDPLKRKDIKYQELINIVKESIEFYNDRPHRSLFGMSPNAMEEALFLQQNQTNSLQIVEQKPIQPLAKNDDSVIAREIIKYKHHVIQEF